MPIVDPTAPTTIYAVDENGDTVMINNPNQYKPKYEVANGGEVVTAPNYLYRLQALGGNVLVETSLELIFPLPFIEDRSSLRSEEHTSELQSRPHLVCRLLLEKKKKKQQHISFVIL